MRWISFRFQYFSTAQKIKFPIKDFFSKCDQIHSFLRMWRHLPKKSLTENFISCAVFHHIIQSILTQCSPHANAPLTKLENQNVSGVLRGIELDYPLKSVNNYGYSSTKSYFLYQYDFCVSPMLHIHHNVWYFQLQQLLRYILKPPCICKLCFFLHFLLVAVTLGIVPCI